MSKRKSKNKRGGSSSRKRDSNQADLQKSSTISAEQGTDESPAVAAKSDARSDASSAANPSVSVRDDAPPAAWMLWAFRLSAVAMVGWMAFLIYLAYQVANG